VNECGKCSIALEPLILAAGIRGYHSPTRRNIDTKLDFDSSKKRELRGWKSG